MDLLRVKLLYALYGIGTSDSLMPITSQHIAYMAKVIDGLDPPQRKRKLSNLCALEYLYQLLRTGMAWRDLIVHSATYHAVYKRLILWKRNDVLTKTWHIIMKEYASRRLFLDPTWFKNIFIDSTMIKNVAGVDGTGANPTDRGREATKLSIICDKKMIAVSKTFYGANKCDVTTLEKSVTEICCKIRKDNRYTTILVGDKGYPSKSNSDFCKRNRMRLLTPWKKPRGKKVVKQRKNARVKKPISPPTPQPKGPYMRPADRQRLKDRHVIENTFCRHDKFKRLFCRVDRFLKTYDAFTLIALSLLATEKMPTLPSSNKK